MNYKRIAPIALAVALMACSKPAGGNNTTAANDSGANTAAMASENVAVPADETADGNGAMPDYSGASLIGMWLDDDKDVTTFNADGTMSTIGKSYKGSWKPDGEDRFDIDVESAAGKFQGIACVEGDTMVMNLNGDINYFGRYGEDGEAAAPDKSVTCE